LIETKTVDAKRAEDRGKGQRIKDHGLRIKEQRA
jgi:hypothetical protein